MSRQNFYKRMASKGFFIHKSGNDRYLVNLEIRAEVGQEQGEEFLQVALDKTPFNNVFDKKGAERADNYKSRI